MTLWRFLEDRTMNIEWKQEWLSLLAIVATFILSAVFYSQLPDPMPIHWNSAGQADDYAPRFIGAFLLPVIMLFIYLLLLVVPRIDPRQKNIERFNDTYTLLRHGILLFMAYIHAVVFYSVLSHQDTLVVSFVVGGVGILFMVIGNYMPRMRSNWFMGIRTPWTLSSEFVWRKTHRLGGRLFILAGLLIFLTAFLRTELTVFAIVLAVVLASLVPIIYSYLLYKQEQEQGPSSA